ncbi:MAG: ATP-binding protein [Pseudomonadota bacterium]
MQEQISSLIQRTASRARTRDYLWANAIAAGVLLVVGISSVAAQWWWPIAAWAAFAAALFVRYRFSAGRAWAAPVQEVFDTEIDAQKAELESLRLARGVAEALPEPLFILDARGIVEHANPAAEEFVNAADLEHRHFSSVLRAPEIFDAVNEVAAGKERQAVDFTSTGAIERFCRAFVAPLGDGERPERILVNIRDLTRERRIEKMRVDFIASASHELRTPLASLLGFIETLRGHARSDPEARERFLGIMQSQAERMQRLVSDLMSLSKIELHEHVPPRDAIDLCDAAQELIESVKPIAENSNITLNYACACQPGVHVVGDRDQVLQAIQNLVDNAVKYGRENDAVDITVGIGAAPILGEDGAMSIGDTLAQLAGRQDGAPEDFGYVQVRDRGRGIPRRYLPRLTERFYRVSVQDSRKAGGTGLGLAIVKHIMNRHGGGLAIESAEGQGSAFTCYFPIAEVEAKAAE